MHWLEIGKLDRATMSAEKALEVHAMDSEQHRAIAQLYSDKLIIQNNQLQIEVANLRTRNQELEKRVFRIEKLMQNKGDTTDNHIFTQYIYTHHKQVLY